MNPQRTVSFQKGMPYDRYQRSSEQANVFDSIDRGFRHPNWKKSPPEQDQYRQHSVDEQLEAIQQTQTHSTGSVVKTLSLRF
ncbi:hypothetical protein C0J52_10050 [Blattella germanica]|nr:hypothetical protein C0J52_10050 [Blattella germanica]